MIGYPLKGWFSTLGEEYFCVFLKHIFLFHVIIKTCVESWFACSVSCVCIWQTMHSPRKKASMPCCSTTRRWMRRGLEPHYWREKYKSPDENPTIFFLPYPSPVPPVRSTWCMHRPATRSSWECACIYIVGLHACIDPPARWPVPVRPKLIEPHVRWKKKTLKLMAQIGLDPWASWSPLGHCRRASFFSLIGLSRWKSVIRVIGWIATVLSVSRYSYERRFKNILFLSYVTTN